MDGHLTTIVLHSKHAPTDKELEATMDSIIATGESQGYAPLRVKAITLEDTRGGTREIDLEASRTVNSGVMQGRWEGN